MKKACYFVTAILAVLISSCSTVETVLIEGVHVVVERSWESVHSEMQYDFTDGTWTNEVWREPASEVAVAIIDNGRIISNGASLSDSGGEIIDGIYHPAYPPQEIPYWDTTYDSIEELEVVKVHVFVSGRIEPLLANKKDYTKFLEKYNEGKATQVLIRFNKLIHPAW